MSAVAAVADLQGEFLAKTEARLEELRPQVEEYNQLSDLRSRLTGSRPSPVASPPRRASTPRSTTGSRKIAPRGSRKAEFLKLVHEQPGISVSEAAAAMSIQPNYLYRIREQAQAEGEIRVEGSSNFPVSV